MSPPQPLTFGRDPNDLTNARGRMPNDRPHIVRMMGTIDVPRRDLPLRRASSTSVGSRGHRVRSFSCRRITATGSCSNRAGHSACHLSRCSTFASQGIPHRQFRPNRTASRRAQRAQRDGGRGDRDGQCVQPEPRPGDALCRSTPGDARRATEPGSLAHAPETRPAQGPSSLTCLGQTGRCPNCRGSGRTRSLARQA